MTREQALDRVNDLKGYLTDVDALSNFKEQINELSLEVLGYGVRDCNCRNRYGDTLIKIYNHLKKELPMANEISCRLKRGVLIHFHGDMYTILNLTDDVARAYLAEFPQNAHFFDKLPEELPTKDAEKAEDVVISAENAPQSQENAEVIVDTPKKKKSRKTAKNG